jgi:peptide deformylase
MAKILQIAQLGHKVLRGRSKPISKISSNKGLIEDLMMTLKEVNGVGVAAPQVYESKRIFIIHSYPNPRYPKAPKFGPIAIINPEIISSSKEITKDWEGCLSIPGIRALVPRPKQILVEYQTVKGKKERKKFKDFVARVFQHEFDHLNGIVYLDRIETTKDIITEKEYLRMISKK